MKNLLIVFAVFCFASFSQAQTTTTVVGSDGHSTKITSSCDQVGNCTVWDSTDEDHIGVGDRHADNKARVKWCTASGFTSTKGGQTPCGLAWQDHKDDVKHDYETHHACEDRFGVDACKGNSIGSVVEK